MSVELKNSYKLVILNNAEVCGHKSHRTVLSDCAVGSYKKYYCFCKDLVMKTTIDSSLKLRNTFVGLS